MEKKWISELDEHFSERKKTKKELDARNDETKKAIKHFMKKEVTPALEDLKDELKRYKRDCDIDLKRSWAAIVVRHNKRKEMVYEVNISESLDGLQVSKSVYLPNDKGKLKLGVEGKIRNPENSLSLEKITREWIIADFLESYKEATRIKKPL